MELTNDTLAVFKALCADAGNWSGSPLIAQALGSFDLKKARGNLSDLKKKKLISVFKDEGCEFAVFEDAGIALAKTLGYDIEDLRRVY